MGGWEVMGGHAVDVTSRPCAYAQGPIKSTPLNPAGKASSWNCRSDCTCGDCTGLSTTK